MTHENKKNGNGVWKWPLRILWVSGSITATIAMLTTIFTIIGGQVYASKESVSSLETKVCEGYVTKEVFNLTLKQYEKAFQEMKEEQQKVDGKVDQVLLLLGKINRDGG